MGMRFAKGLRRHYGAFIYIDLDNYYHQLSITTSRDYVSTSNVLHAESPEHCCGVIRNCMSTPTIQTLRPAPVCSQSE